MSEESILETALRVLKCYVGTGKATPDPGDIALLHEAAEIPGNEAEPDALAVYIVQRELQRKVSYLRWWFENRLLGKTLYRART
jgi:hypothetical protein